MWRLWLLASLVATASAASSVDLFLQLPPDCQVLALPPKASKTEDEERGCFNDYEPNAAGDPQRLLRFGAPGCGGDVEHEPPQLSKTVKCDATKLTPEMCGAMCFSLGQATDGKPYRLAGVEDANQCFCDMVRNPSYPVGNKREAETECNSPCGGDPAKMCGGFKRIEIYTLSCTTAWGWPVVITLLVCFMCYFGGGIGYNVKTKGVPLGLSALPNTEFW